MARGRADLGNRTSTVLGRRLGGELLRLRDAAGLTQPQAAEALSATAAKIAKMERGWVPMRDPDIRALCGRYGVRDGRIVDRLLEFARADRERRKARGWWNDYSEFRDMAEYVALEAVATNIRTWQLALVPGLFQTSAYVRALCAGDTQSKDPKEIERLVEARTARQQRLFADNALNLWAVVSETALRQLIGGAGTMRAQMDHLLHLAELPHVTLQVLPYSAGAHPGLGSAFNILSFAEPGSMDVVYMETPFSSLWLESAEEAARHNAVFELIARHAADPPASTTMIEHIREELTEHA